MQRVKERVLACSPVLLHALMVSRVYLPVYQRRQSVAMRHVYGIPSFTCGYHVLF
jgi:hypothetical protein